MPGTELVTAWRVSKVIDSSNDKVKKICDVLVKETLEPAQKEAADIVEAAKLERTKIINKAKKEAEKKLAAAEEEIAERQRVFDSSLKVATQKMLTHLKDRIENDLFHSELDAQIKGALGQKDTVIRVIESLVAAMEKEGVTGDLQVAIASHFKSDEICADLLEATRSKLQGKPHQLSGSVEGVTLKSEKSHLSIGITEEAVKELLVKYAQESLRKIIFAS